MYFSCAYSRPPFDSFSVRRVKKTRDSTPSSSTVPPSAAPMSTNENDEIITRADGKRVRKIRKTKPNPSEVSNQLSGFLESQPKSLHSSGAATVSGATITQSERKNNAGDGRKESSQLKEENSLGSFLGNTDSKPRKMGSASVAGDQVAISKESSLTGEVYIREDGKKGKTTFVFSRLNFSRNKLRSHMLETSTTRQENTDTTGRPS